MAIDVADADGARQTVSADHVIAATGYKVSLQQLPFLDSGLRTQIAGVQDTPKLSTNFESSVAGLYFTGLAAANSFGPLLRFMVGAEFASPRLAGHLRRRIIGDGPMATSQRGRSKSRA